MCVCAVSDEPTKWKRFVVVWNDRRRSSADAIIVVDTLFGRLVDWVLGVSDQMKLLKTITSMIWLKRIHRWTEFVFCIVIVERLFADAIYRTFIHACSWCSSESHMKRSGVQKKWFKATRFELVKKMHEFVWCKKVDTKKKVQEKKMQRRQCEFSLVTGSGCYHPKQKVLSSKIPMLQRWSPFN